MNKDTSEPAKPELLVVGHMPPPVTGENICRFRLCEELGALGGAVVNVRRFDREAWSGTPDAVLLLPGQSWRGTLADVALTLLWGRRGVPVYWYFHNRSWMRFALVPSVIWKRIASIRPVLITGSIHKVFAKKRMKAFLLRNAPEPMFVAATEGKTFRKRLVYVGRICSSKGFYPALDVFRALYDLDEQWVFDVYGSGDDVAELVAPFGKAVTLHGWTSGEKKLRAYEGGGIVLFPSRYKNETSPMVIIESLSQGVPVVAYDVGGIAEMLMSPSSGRGGIALPRIEQNTEGVIRAIQAIAQEYEAYSRKAIALFTELFGPERYAKEVAQLFEPVLGTAPSDTTAADTKTPKAGEAAQVDAPAL